MTDDNVKRIDPDMLDFSHWHPLDHWPFDKRCRTFHGGGWNHLKMTWEFRRYPELRARTLCRVGIHKFPSPGPTQYVETKRRDGTWHRTEVRVGCYFCWKTPPWKDGEK